MTDRYEKTPSPEVGCRCIDCGGNQPGHDQTCSYMHELHGEQTAAVGVDANELTGVRARLKSGDYDGADVMRAWLAIDKLLAQQPAAVDGAMDKERFKRAPCYLCGYNGPGYYQPDTHPCAAKYHAAQPGGSDDDR